MSKRTESRVEAFWGRVEKTDDGCWIWTGSKRGGYGRFRHGGRLVGAHRFAYELLVGPIPDGLQLDHLCHTRDLSCHSVECPHRACVRPDHLEPVTSAENARRGRAALVLKAAAAERTVCPEGHTYGTEAGGKKRCHECRRIRIRARASGRPTGRPATIPVDEVLQLVAGGLPYAQVAVRVGCSPASVGRIVAGKQRVT